MSLEFVVIVFSRDFLEKVFGLLRAIKDTLVMSTKEGHVSQPYLEDPLEWDNRIHLLGYIRTLKEVAPEVWHS